MCHTYFVKQFEQVPVLTALMRSVDLDLLDHAARTQFVISRLRSKAPTSSKHTSYFYSYAREFMRMFTRAAHIITCLAPTHECTTERVLYIANSAHTFSVATAVCCLMSAAAAAAMPLTREARARKQRARAFKLQRSQNNVSHKHNTTPYSARAARRQDEKKICVCCMRVVWCMYTNRDMGSV